MQVVVHKLVWNEKLLQYQFMNKILKFTYNYQSCSLLVPPLNFGEANSLVHMIVIIAIGAPPFKKHLPLPMCDVIRYSLKFSISAILKLIVNNYSPPLTY